MVKVLPTSSDLTARSTSGFLLGDAAAAVAAATHRMIRTFSIRDIMFPLCFLGFRSRNRQNRLTGRCLRKKRECRSRRDSDEAHSVSAHLAK